MRESHSQRPDLRALHCRKKLNFLLFYFWLDLELEHEGATQGSTSQPVRRNISLKLKAKSKSASSLTSGKSKKKEGKSSERSRSGSDGK